MSELDLELSAEPTRASLRSDASTADVDDRAVQAAFRGLMREIAQPVAVLTGRDGRGSPWGMTLTSFTSVSMDPPLIVVCPGSASRTWSRIRPTGRFVLNLLHRDQASVADAFAGTGMFPRDIPHRFTIDGLPVLTESIAAARCLTTRVFVGGDHDVVLARVTRVRVNRRSSPLAYRRGDYVAPERIGVAS